MAPHRPTEPDVELSEAVLDIAGQPHPADMVTRVPQLAAKLIDCAAADLIRITDRGELRITASSDPEFSELTRGAWRRWPHATIPQFPPSENLTAAVQRSNYLQQLRTDVGVAQELIVPLVAGSADHGYLRFLFTGPAAGPDGRALITAFCAHAAIALDRAALLVQIDHLRLALDSNRTIGAAIGVLMARHGLSYSDGLRALKVASQQANRRLHDVASDVLCTGRLAAPLPPRKAYARTA